MMKPHLGGRLRVRLCVLLSDGGKKMEYDLAFERG